MLYIKEKEVKNKMTKKYLKLGAGLVGASVVTGAIPNLTGSATETGLKTNLATGLGHTGKALPIAGKVKGTQLIVNAVKKLKPLKIKGAYKL